MKKRVAINKLCFILIISLLILIALSCIYIHKKKESKSLKNKKIAILKENKEIAQIVEQEENVIEIIIENNYYKEDDFKEETECDAENQITIYKRDIYEDRNIELQIIGEPKEMSINALREEINKIPENIKQDFISDGWKMCITDEDVAEKYFNYSYKNVIAVTNYSNKRIIFEDRDPDTIAAAIFHELGHYIDYKKGMPSLSSTFREIYQEEVDDFKNKISNPGCVFDPKEFFAEAFNYSITNPTCCTPKVLAFFKNLNIAY